MDIEKIIETVTVEEIQETKEIVEASYESNVVNSRMIMIAFD